MQGFHSLLTLVVLQLQKTVRANVTVFSMEVLLPVFYNTKCKQFGQYLQFHKAIAQWAKSRNTRSNYKVPVSNSSKEL